MSLEGSLLQILVEMASSWCWCRKTAFNCGWKRGRQRMWPVKPQTMEGMEELQTDVCRERGGRADMQGKVWLLLWLVGKFGSVRIERRTMESNILFWTNGKRGKFSQQMGLPGDEKSSFTKIIVPQLHSWDADSIRKNRIVKGRLEVLLEMMSAGRSSHNASKHSVGYKNSIMICNDASKRALQHAGDKDGSTVCPNLLW